MKTLNDKSHLGVEGHVVIRDADSGEMLLDKYNAINFENFALAVANSLANQTTNSNNHFIAKLAFGYGGTTIDANGNVTYKDPKVSGSTGGLYSPSPATIGANATTTPLQVAQAKENHFVNGVPGATQNGITINNDGTRPTQQTTGEPPDSTQSAQTLAERGFGINDTAEAREQYAAAQGKRRGGSQVT